jgi:hypothetical protein
MSIHGRESNHENLVVQAVAWSLYDLIYPGSTQRIFIQQQNTLRKQTAHA